MFVIEKPIFLEEEKQKTLKIKTAKSTPNRDLRHDNCKTTQNCKI